LLFILGLLNDVVGSSDYIESNDNMINEWVRKDVEGSVRGLI
jgi:hypothetical protein